MGVDLGRTHIAMTELFLHRADIRAAFEQMRGKGMAQGMTARRLVDARGPYRTLDRALYPLLIQMMPAPTAAARIIG